MKRQQEHKDSEGKIINGTPYGGCYELSNSAEMKVVHRNEIPIMIT